MTNKEKINDFISKKRVIIISLIITTIILIILFFYMSYIMNYKKYLNSDFGIDTYTSLIDKDNDGLDDQSDIIINARNYIATKPKYKSNYYKNIGYPNDGNGVCTDVVAFSLKDAGYDLMNLVYEHVSENIELYDIDEIDKSIDFRRVKNLAVYFKNTAIALTTDINKIEEWQGGDIVVFKGHVGIISDKRNRKGIPYVIHHARPMQTEYEEDILENRDDIIGHYRIS